MAAFAVSKFRNEKKAVQKEGKKKEEKENEKKEKKEIRREKENGKYTTPQALLQVQEQVPKWKR